MSSLYNFILNKSIIWKEIKGFPNYKVSNFGQVRNSKTGYLLKPTGSKTKTYRYVSLYNEKNCPKKIHKIVADHFLPEKPSEKHQIAHNDGDPLNNAASNLRWATPKENSADKVLHGRQPRGEDHGPSVLKEYQVKEILLIGGTTASLCRKYGVSDRTITRIKKRETWKHV